jgi:FKBP-type peptidyl-prolyl cis-trans isomerase
MQRFSISLMGVLLGISLVTAAVEQSAAKVANANVADAKVANAKVSITRSERCSNLSRQFDEALETHAAATQVTAAKALQRKGNRFCANKKQAQGIRMLANALKLLGVTPNDPVQ